MNRIKYILLCNPYKSILAVLTGLYGYFLHKSLFWSAIDAVFFPLAIVKWVIFNEISVNSIKHAIEFWSN